MNDQFGKNPLRKTKAGKLIKKFSNRYFRLKKWWYLALLKYKDSDRCNVFIFGCQRSGTTLLGRVFDQDLRSSVLQENNILTTIINGEDLRLKPFPEVLRNLARIRAPLIVTKPLVESAHAPTILKEIPQSKGIWMFRDFKDVVASNVKRFSSQLKGLKLATFGSPPSWRSEGMSEETKGILKSFYRDDIPVADAAALGWYSRNVLFFELGLDKHGAVKLCKYEDLVQHPDSTMRNLYNFIGVPYPPWTITREIDQFSLKLGRVIKINHDIVLLCTDLQNRLLSAYSSQS